MILENPQTHADSAPPLIALIGATTAAIAPARMAFHAEFPEVKLWNLIDDRLLIDAAEAERVTSALTYRMSRLIEYAVEGKADAILLTCSLYSSVAHSMNARVDIPVFASDDALFAAILSGEYRSILIVTSLHQVLRDVRSRFAQREGFPSHPIKVTGVVAEGAFTAATSNDEDLLSESLAAAVTATLQKVETPDALVLAQYSLSASAEQLSHLTGLPVLSAPATASRALRGFFLGGSPSLG